MLILFQDATWLSALKIWYIIVFFKVNLVVPISLFCWIYIWIIYYFRNKIQQPFEVTIDDEIGVDLRGLKRHVLSILVDWFELIHTIHEYYMGLSEIESYKGADTVLACILNMFYFRKQSWVAFGFCCHLQANYLFCNGIMDRPQKRNKKTLFFSVHWTIRSSGHLSPPALIGWLPLTR